MAPPEDNPEMILIFDLNGFIAGMHSVVAKKFVSPMFDFGGSKWYREFGNAFVTTVYFIDPMRICNGGRTKEEYDVEGTGNHLLFQNGPKSSDHVVAPLTQQEADSNVSLFCCVITKVNYDDISSLNGSSTTAGIAWVSTTSLPPLTTIKA